MAIQYWPDSADSPPHVSYDIHERRTAVSYERELIRRRRTEIGLREALAREEALLGEKDKLIRQQEILSQESDHQTVERPANDRKPAFAAKPGNG